VATTSTAMVDDGTPVSGRKSVGGATSGASVTGGTAMGETATEGVSGADSGGAGGAAPSYGYHRGWQVASARCSNDPGAKAPSGTGRGGPAD
jgi:hypothetical protein